MERFDAPAGPPGAEPREERVGVFGLKSMRDERRRRKILQIRSDDNVGFGPDGSGEDMTIARIGQVEGGHEILESGDEGIANMGIHEAPGARQACRREARSAAQERADPLVMDMCGPPRSVQIRDGELKQQIAKWRRVQDRGVEESNFDRQGSIAHAQGLGVGGKRVERAAPRGVRRVLVPAQILESYAAVRADPAKRDIARFHQTDQEGSRDVQVVGGLLHGQLGVAAWHGDGVAGGHVLEDLEEQYSDRRWDFDGLASLVTGDTERQSTAGAQERTEALAGCAGHLGIRR